MKALLERLDIVTKSPKVYLCATAKDIKEQLNSSAEFKVRHKLDEKNLEEEEIKLGHFTKNGDSALKLATDKLIQGNKELGLKQIAA